MSRCSSKLTICFEDPFWIALIELEDNGSYSVARHVFGPEPSQPEVEAFVASNWNRLRFTEEVEVEKIGGSSDKRINPKRLRRIIEKEMAQCPTRGTKAQQALAEQREAAAQERKASAKQRKEELKDERFRQKQAKRKEKHRGH